jgi:hypothetical protein
MYYKATAKKNMSFRIIRRVFITSVSREVWVASPITDPSFSCR